MLQINHIYEFLISTLFKDFEVVTPPNGLPSIAPTLTNNDIHVFNYNSTSEKIFIWDQEPLIDTLVDRYVHLVDNKYKPLKVLVTSEVNGYADRICDERGFSHLYYFFHGFASLDWYRGYYALNYSKQLPTTYHKDYITFNRLISHDRSYRNYFVSKLVECNLLSKGLVSYNVANDYKSSWQEEIEQPFCKLSNNAKAHIKTHLSNISQLSIDSLSVPGWASADILRKHEHSAFWHVVSETVFYYNKQHLTEKVFKPIVNKQPFMLLAGTNSLEYLKSYGFKTFSNVIDESYDNIIDPDQRIDAVVSQLNWYCNLDEKSKQNIIKEVIPIVEHNFSHFYGDFKEIITKELLNNTRKSFNEIGYNDSNIDYFTIQKLLTK